MITIIAKYATLGVWAVYWLNFFANTQSRKNEEKPMFAGKKSIGTTISIFALFTILYSMIWLQKEAFINHIPSSWSAFLLFIGYIFLLTGLAISIWARNTIGNAFSFKTQIALNQPLADKGPYKYVRHPIYLGFILIWLGSSFVSLNIIGSALFIIFLPIMCYRMRIEEKNLLEVYGSQYESYRAVTGKILPKLSGLIFSSGSKPQA